MRSIYMRSIQRLVSPAEARPGIEFRGLAAAFRGRTTPSGGSERGLGPLPDSPQRSRTQVTGAKRRIYRKTQDRRFGDEPVAVDGVELFESAPGVMKWSNSSVPSGSPLSRTPWPRCRAVTNERGSETFAKVATFGACARGPHPTALERCRT